jgi:cytidine deaminase
MNVLPVAQADALMQEAKIASQKAYAPYSQFPVGAAILLENGEVLQGCNVENASYGLTLCAERNALVQRIARGLGKHAIQAIAVYAEQTPHHHITPCGACRQVIAEFATPNTLMLWYTPQGHLHQMKALDLLPDSFSL